MSPTMKVISINLVVLVLYNLLLSQDRSGYFVIGIAFAIVFQVLANIVVGTVLFLMGRKNLAKGFLLSTVVVLLVGFPLCLVVAQ